MMQRLAYKHITSFPMGYTIDRLSNQIKCLNHSIYQISLKHTAGSKRKAIGKVYTCKEQSLEGPQNLRPRYTVFICPALSLSHHPSH